MSLDQQIASLDRAVERFAGAVVALPGRSFLEVPSPAAHVRWSPRDIVAHLIGWNRYVIRGCDELRRGALPFYDVDPGPDYSAVNVTLVEEYSSPLRDDLLLDLRRSARELRGYLVGLPSGEWERDCGVVHRGEKLTVGGTVGDLIEDYDHHRRQLQRWPPLPTRR